MSRILPLVTLPDARLRRPSRRVDSAELATATVQTLIDNMIATMWRADGIGIAAVQVGENVRIVVITRGDEPVVLVNPRFTLKSLRSDTLEEGCLSVPGYYGPVRRSRTVRVRALDRNGNPLRLKLTGLPARIMQHEVDHTNGILFVDRARSVSPAPTE